MTITVEPERIVDTRIDLGVTDAFTTDMPRDVQVTGEVPVVSGGTAEVVPADAVAVLVNVTVVNPASAGFLSLRPGGAVGEPSTSTVNFTAAGAVEPNAATVDLAGGKVQVYVLTAAAGGTADVLIDVVGYTIGHAHDDRYYTKSQADSRYEQLDPWQINIAPSDMTPQPGGPVYSIHDGKAGAMGMGFGDDDRCCIVVFGVRLPDQYVAGAPVVLDIDWSPASTATVNPVGCSFIFLSFLPRVSRPGSPMFVIDTSWADGSPAFTVTDAALNDLVASTKRLELESTDLEPGDRLHVFLQRVPGDIGDSCEGVASVHGITVREG